MKVAFMGTPAFAVPVLDALIAAGHEIAGVWSQPPRPAGRGQQPRLSPVAARAQEAGLAVHHPTGWRTPDALSTLAAAAPEVAVVVAYGRILPQAALDVPPLGAFNVHASLLPRWRGAAPIQRAILAGDRETGVSIMRMEAGLDTGPVLMARAVPISAGDTAGDLHDRLSALGAALMVETLANLGHLQAVPQPEAGVTYAAMIDKAEARIDWRRPAVEVDRQIRGLSPFPGAWCEAAGERLKLLRSRLAPGHGAPGEVLDGFRIACGTGAVEVLEAQRPGKRALAAADILRGRPLPMRLD